jgi:surface protein
VQNMEGMFANTPSFNGDLSLWNVSRVTTLRRIFRQATSFNSDISNWDVSRVTDMTQMVTCIWCCSKWVFFKSTQFLLAPNRYALTLNFLSKF